ncbi:MAG TPA: hypothetical protein PK522_00755 [Nitrosomonas sp.]|nr:hypothetical protein [Nitrosomonas sp.]
MNQVSAIASALIEIITLGYKVYDLIHEAKRKGWVSDGRSLSQQIAEAKTDEERAELAKRLFNHIK